MSKPKYIEVSRQAIPSDLRWDVSGRDHGQIIEVAYAHARNAKSEACSGAAYKRVTDASEPTGSPNRVAYYRLAKAGE